MLLFLEYDSTTNKFGKITDKKIWNIGFFFYFTCITLNNYTIKKLCFSLIATVLFTSISLANTIDVQKNQLLSGIQTVDDEKISPETLRFCYHMSTVVTEPVPGVIKTTKTYMCFDHPELPGDGNVLIGG